MRLSWRSTDPRSLETQRQIPVDLGLGGLHADALTTPDRDRHDSRHQAEARPAEPGEGVLAGRVADDPGRGRGEAAPNWCEANTQPNTIVPDVPNASRHSAAVGGTVATQSSP